MNWENRPESRDIYLVRLRYMRQIGPDEVTWPEVDYYALVPSGGGPEIVAEAARLALSAVIGPPESWGAHHAVVLRVEYLGTGAMSRRSEE